ncbi:MAG: potassium-transporting ATPase subunit KdpB [Candidatus Brocadiia bacterium]|jgi:K+-transporting ATPase ATPase B chain
MTPDSVLDARSTASSELNPSPQARRPRRVKRQPLLTRDTCLPALKQAAIMLRPDIQWNNPVMFVVEVGACLTLLYIGKAIFGTAASQVPLSYFIALDIWLFLTVLFANFATALAEARGKAHAESLRRTRVETVAYRLRDKGQVEQVSSAALRPGDKVVVSAGQIIPGDGEVIEGIASVDEAAITGESAPVIRESGGDRSGVTGGTTVQSDRIVVRITAQPGESFLDRMIALVEGAKRQRTPNEIALTLLLSAFTLVFLIVVIPLYPMAWNAEQYMMGYLGVQEPLHSLGTDVPTLIALLVCLIPTTIGALLAAIGIAGMDRALEANIIAKSGKAVETAGDIDVVLLDKTGTITLGNRRAVEFIPADGVATELLASSAQMASLSDETPEGRSIVVLAKEKYKLRAWAAGELRGTFIPFSAQTRMSGIDLEDGQHIRKGASEAVEAYVKQHGGTMPADVRQSVEKISRLGGTPLVVASQGAVLGVVHLKDIIKGGIKERFEHLRKMGVNSVMITGDNPLTAAAIAAEAGVNDFLAEATPEQKLAFIRKEQAEGKLVAMMGDGTNDAPALAQGDVALAMNAGTQAAKEAANMVDLDSDPTKLIEVVEIGKQLLMTRGALTTFSIANDVAKYFAIIPALFAGTLPWLKAIDIMHLHSPTSAILSAIIFNALIIPALIPVALKGVSYRPLGADALLRRNLFIWGLGGVILPFIGIKLIDVFMVALHLVN